jgi:peptidyl-tRNA hydrolase, PTH1 family
VPKRLIVGLGNPGPQYKKHRHNVDFMVADLLAKAWEIPLQREKHQSVFGRGTRHGLDVILAKPQTFMNLSGDSVCEWVRKEGLKPETDLLVVCDEMQLVVGRVRLRPSGSSGSHNGLESVQERLGSSGYARLRLGVDKPDHPSQWADWVLSSFKPEEKDPLEKALEKACLACDLWLSEPDIEKVMSKVNGKTGES